MVLAPKPAKPQTPTPEVIIQKVEIAEVPPVPVVARKRAVKVIREP